MYGVEEVKEMFKVEDKQGKRKDFVGKVIEGGKNEVEEVSGYRLEWWGKKEGKKIVSLKLYGILKGEDGDGEVQKKEVEKERGV